MSYPPQQNQYYNPPTTPQQHHQQQQNQQQSSQFQQPPHSGGSGYQQPQHQQKNNYQKDYSHSTDTNTETHYHNNKNNNNYNQPPNANTPPPPSYQQHQPGMTGPPGMGNQPPIVNVQIPPPVTTTAANVKHYPGQVDHSIIPEKRILSGITSMEQVWRMPLLYEGKPTWKFWLFVLVAFYFIWILALPIVIVKRIIAASYYSNYYTSSTNCPSLSLKNCPSGLGNCIRVVAGCYEYYCTRTC